MSIAKVKIKSFVAINTVGEKEINQAISGFSSSTPFETAYNVHKASAILPKWHIMNQASKLIFFAINNNYDGRLLFCYF